MSLALSLPEPRAPPTGQGFPMPLSSSQSPSLEGSEGGGSGTRDTGSSIGTGTTTSNKPIVHADGTFSSTPCTLHNDGEIQ
jgi:hypothetical protein